MTQPSPVEQTDMLRALRASGASEAPAQPAPSGWRDIASAPKDGTKIWLWGKRKPEVKLWRWAYFIGSQNGEWRSCDKEAQGWAANNGPDWSPTHWQPFAAPPPPHVPAQEAESGNCPCCDGGKEVWAANVQLNTKVARLEVRCRKLEAENAALAGALRARVVNMSYDWPAERAEPCGLWCDLCQEHVEEDGSGHAATCLLHLVDPGEKQ